MNQYYKSLFYLDVDKINIPKGILQFLLMLIPLLAGYFLGNLPAGLLISIGSLANIYVFSGTLQNKIKTAILATFTLTVAIMLGTLTADYKLLFGFLLFLFTVVPYYVCSVLEIKGPSSTFFVVAFGLSSIMPGGEGEVFHRALLVMTGGLLTVIVLIIFEYITRGSYEQAIVVRDYQRISALLKKYNEPEAFKEQYKSVVRELMASSDALHAARPAFNKRAAKYERTLLLHHVAERIYSEILDLFMNTNSVMPPVIIEMVDYVTEMIESGKAPHTPWQKSVEVPEEYNTLVEHIFKVEEILFAPDAHLDLKMIDRRPSIMTRLVANLTLDSSVMIMTIKYALIMSVAIFVALTLQLDRPYWVAITAHSVLVGNTTITSLQRAASRFLGTLFGFLIVASLVWLNPDMWIIIIILAITAGFTEVFVASNYTIAMIWITIQVLLLSGIAVKHISYSFGYLRIIDVLIGVVITVIGVCLLGRKTSSERLPGLMAKLARVEASTFHYLFSNEAYLEKHREKDMAKLYLNLFNVRMTYTNAYGELSSEKQHVLALYPAIIHLEMISFCLQRVIMDGASTTLQQEKLSRYLLAFENVAQRFERGAEHAPVALPPLERYGQINKALTELQQES